MPNPDQPADIASGSSAPKHLSDAAQRALAEAEARRAKPRGSGPREYRGRAGLDPVRYGDWEVKGVATDF